MQASASFLTGIVCTKGHDDSSSYHLYDDPACGRYAIHEDIVEELRDDIQTKRRLACVLAQRKCRGSRTWTFIEEPDNTVTRPSPWIKETVDSLLRLYPANSYSILEETFINFSKMVDHPSEEIIIESYQYWLAYCFDDASFLYMKREFLNLGYIVSGTDLPPTGFRIANKGWQFLAERQQNRNESKKGFVAMWFDPSMLPFYEQGIYPSIQNDCKYQCVRIDLKDHNNKICDEIIAEIRSSKFLVADATGGRVNVFYEAGVAYGLNIPVIWVVSKAWVEDKTNQLGFDTRQYNHIIYDSVADLQTKLTNRIRATIY